MMASMNPSSDSRPGENTIDRPFHKPEILAPAGDAVALRTALDAGADAVYFGAGSLNMRARARNFALDDIDRTVRLCHESGARAYMAMNTIIFENELSLVETTLDSAVQAGVDAVICWDSAVAAAAGERNLEVHLSTQASVSNSRAIISRYRLENIRRFVLARECTIEQIRDIRTNLKKALGDEADRIELEMFIHGAMCISVSGRCFLSEFSSGQSGNRGACLQPCRREYRIMDVEGEYEYEIGRDYVMSPKDLCTMPFIDSLIDAGAASLKIEGRMRNPEYVAAVVSSYRQAVDVYCDRVRGTSKEDPLRGDFKKLKEELTEKMRSVFNRGFSNGYYMGRPLGDWAKSANSRATLRKETVGIVANYYRKAKAAEIKVQGASFVPGDTLLIQGPTTGSLEVPVEEIQINHQPVNQAVKGGSVAIRVPSRVRPGDAVYRRFEVENP